jgi:hypothetical protein
MPLPHHLADLQFLLPERVDQDQELAGLDVLVKLRELAVLVADADQSAFPGAEQRCDADQRHVNEGGDLDAERVEVVDRPDPQQAHEQSAQPAEHAVTDDVERLQVVARVNVLLLESRLVARDHVDEEVLDPDGVQVVRNTVGAVQRRRQVIKALHLLPPLQIDATRGRVSRNPRVDPPR